MPDFMQYPVSRSKGQATELSPIFSGVCVKAAKKRGQPWRIEANVRFVALVCAEGSPHFLLTIHSRSGLRITPALV